MEDQIEFKGSIAAAKELLLSTLVAYHSYDQERLREYGIALDKISKALDKLHDNILIPRW